MGLILPQKSLRQLGGRPLWLPIGFRGRGLPGSGGNADATNNSINDLTIWQAPSFSAVRAVKLVYAGFDMSNAGPVDRGQIVTGYASVFLPGVNPFLVAATATIASGSSTFTAYCSAGLQGNAITQGQTISGPGIPAGTYVVSAVPSYVASTGVLAGYTITMSQQTTAAIATTQTLSVSGQFYPSRWGGRRQMMVEPMHDLLVSDDIPVQLAANQLFGVKASLSFAATVNAIADYPAPASGSTRLVLSGLSESCNRGSSLGDLSLVPTQPSNTGGGYWPPAMILGLLTDANPHPAVVILGDSIAAGTGDSADSNGRMGYVQKSLGNSVPWATTARGSTSATQLAGNVRGSFRMAVEANATDILLEHVRNDINAGVSAAAVKQALAAVAAPFIAAGMRVWVFTCPPTTTSTDSWITATNQSIPNSSYESARQSYNADIRANWANYGYAGLADVASVVEDPQNLGKWRTNGGAWTVEGIHPNVLGHSSLVSAGVIKPGMFIL